MSAEPPLRFVFDTNVLVSAALFPGSVPRRGLHLARSAGLILVSSDTLDELEGVLARGKLDRYLDEPLRFEFFELIKRTSTVVEINERVRACRDEKDDRFLEVAINGGAAWIVSGDRDLLVLDPFRSVHIATPARFVETMDVQRDR